MVIQRVRNLALSASFLHWQATRQRSKRMSEIAAKALVRHCRGVMIMVFLEWSELVADEAAERARCAEIQQFAAKLSESEEAMSARVLAATAQKINARRSAKVLRAWCDCVQREVSERREMAGYLVESVFRNVLTMESVMAARGEADRATLQLKTAVRQLSQERSRVMVLEKQTEQLEHDARVQEGALGDLVMKIERNAEAQEGVIYDLALQARMRERKQEEELELEADGVLAKSLVDRAFANALVHDAAQSAREQATMTAMVQVKAVEGQLAQERRRVAVLEEQTEELERNAQAHAQEDQQQQQDQQDQKQQQQHQFHQHCQ